MGFHPPIIEELDVLLVDCEVPLKAVHPQKELSDGEFTGPGRADDERDFVRGEEDGDVGEDGDTRTRWVSKGDVVEGQFARTPCWCDLRTRTKSEKGKANLVNLAMRPPAPMGPLFSVIPRWVLRQLAVTNRI